MADPRNVPAPPLPPEFPHPPPSPTPALLGMVKQFEGLRLIAYKDLVGVWTIGYGATGPGVHAGLVWTQEQADNDLIDRLTDLYPQVYGMLINPTTMNWNQLDALTAFSYNLGIGALKTSKLLRFVNEGMFDLAAEQFPLWNHAGREELPGLTARRLAEQRLFLEV